EAFHSNFALRFYAPDLDHGGWPLDKDLCAILGLHPNVLNKYLSELIDAGRIESEELPRGVFFKVKTPPEE
ncbi:MAG: hypothetical protein R6T89_05925, partial [Candidatus Syntrophosphaera sp.]